MVDELVEAADYADLKKASFKRDSKTSSSELTAPEHDSDAHGVKKSI
jgi:hypothetical protein